MMDRPVIDLAPLFDDACSGKIPLSELIVKLDEYSKQEGEGTISLCYKDIPIFKSECLML